MDAETRPDVISEFRVSFWCEFRRWWSWGWTRSEFYFDEFRVPLWLEFRAMLLSEFRVSSSITSNMHHSFLMWTLLRTHVIILTIQTTKSTKFTVIESHCSIHLVFLQWNMIIEYSNCLAKFWGCSNIAVILLNSYQNLECRMIYAFIYHGLFTC